MPVIMALLSIWYNNFFDAVTHAILPYAQGLKRFPAYLQQAEMESNGKRITYENKPVDYQTGQVILGETGTNGQHAFYQLLHQGTRLISSDFIVPLQTHYPLSEQHALLVANAFAQSKTLMEGQTLEEVEAELLTASFTFNQIQSLVSHKILPGNQPTNTLLMKKLTPFTLGSLLALYEHKIFVQSVIWNINAFDQFGVERGKQLAEKVLPDLLKKETSLSHDASTNGLIKRYHASI
jgi:glucose-6-phosphate isomerase